MLCGYKLFVLRDRKLFRFFGGTRGQTNARRLRRLFSASRKRNGTPKTQKYPQAGSGSLFGSSFIIPTLVVVVVVIRQVTGTSSAKVEGPGPLP